MINGYGNSSKTKIIHDFLYCLDRYNIIPEKARVFSESIRHRWHSCLRKCRIQGRVTDADGITPLKDIWVYVPYYKREFGSNTDADGNYNIRGLEIGTYQVRFHDKSGKYIHYSIDGIKCSHRQKIARINASLSVAGHIKGRVTGADGKSPLKGIDVNIAMRDGAYWQFGGNIIRLGGYWIRSGETKTDVEGYYDIGNLIPEIYRIRLGDMYSNYNYSFEYYNNKPSLEKGDDIIVHAGETITGINASLTLTGTMKVLVKGSDGMTPLQNMQFAVGVYLWDGAWSMYESFFHLSTDKDGICNIPMELTPGIYGIVFLSCDRKYYCEDPPCKNLSEAVSVSSGQTVTCIKSLELTSHIQGRVMDQDSKTPLNNIKVTTIRWKDGEWKKHKSGKIDSNGNYDIGSLISGSYRIKFHDKSGQYLTRYYNNQSSIEFAEEINIIQGQTITGIDAVLRRDRSMRCRIN